MGLTLRAGSRPAGTKTRPGPERTAAGSAHGGGACGEAHREARAEARLGKGRAKENR
jgi:hypothetical protein